MDSCSDSLLLTCSTPNAKQQAHLARRKVALDEEQRASSSSGQAAALMAQHSSRFLQQEDRELN